MKNFDFKNLIIFDLANNHQGNLDHGKLIIDTFSNKSKNYDFNFGIKFQFRNLDTFIHKNHKNKTDINHINRFQGTRLEFEEYRVLKNTVKKNNLYAICTPFDEVSVKIIKDMEFDILKIASCSANDWPLLEEAASSGMPIVCSTGGLKLSEVDDLYSFFKHKGVDFAFMHCVSIYPTDLKDLQLNQIDFMKKRYPDIVVGWSTHENQDETVPVQMAYAKGARMFERHIGIATNKIILNKYSSTPDQIKVWLESLNLAKIISGSEGQRHEIRDIEKDSLQSLKRGVYASKNLLKGDVLDEKIVYFAMPLLEGQLSSSDFKNNIIIDSPIKKDEPLNIKDLTLPKPKLDFIFKKANHEVKAMLNEAKIFLNTEFKIEYSHHDGIEEFRKTGAVLIDIVNRDYCKKIIIQLPGQNHPEHFHKRKEETFQVLYGILNLTIEGRKKTLYPGDTALVLPGTWHSFNTLNGCVFEEISTKHFNDDSFYKDKRINSMKRDERKTIVNHWGRYELPEKLNKNNS